MRSGALAALSPSTATQRGEDKAIVGKDVLELLSTAMYIDPLTIYREYIQNAADAIDEARAAGLIAATGVGEVDITIDPSSRTIRIRDNGIALDPGSFTARMKALGASRKRGTNSRGFRGVGRLAGLAYGQRLAFRSRTSEAQEVLEFAWDCRKLRTALRSDEAGDVVELIDNITEFNVLNGEWPSRFFEVEISGIVRLGDDRLMGVMAVSDYLSQVAPVPFSKEFTFGERIEEMLREHIGLGNLRITINGGEPLTRPHRDLMGTGKVALNLRDLRTIEITGADGGIAALGWIAHHEYAGAIANSALVKGVRLRVGNVQVGDTNLLESVFPETRFNHWTVGEIHVVDRRIVPNGRRDNFEHNVHFANLVNQMSPAAREVARRCRTSSISRKRARDLEVIAMSVEQRLGILEQGALDASAKKEASNAITSSLVRMEKLADARALDPADEVSTHLERIQLFRDRLDAATGGEAPASALDSLPEERQEMFREMFGLIYECSSNRVAAKALVDRIIAKIS